MMNWERIPFSRRYFLRKSIDWSLTGGAAIVIASCSESEDSSDAASTCVDPTDLAPEQISLRKSLDYTDTSDDPAKVCGNCAFFTGEGNGTCGNCELLDGPVINSGYCTSWSSQA